MQVSVKKKETWAVNSHLLCPCIFAIFSIKLWPPQNPTVALQQKYARKGVCCPHCDTGNQLASPLLSTLSRPKWSYAGGSQKVCSPSEQSSYPPKGTRRQAKSVKRNGMTIVFCIQERAQTWLLKKTLNCSPKM